MKKKKEGKEKYKQQTHFSGSKTKLAVEKYLKTKQKNWLEKKKN
jgi:hypothetical protein